MTAAAPRTAAPEARMARVELAYLDCHYLSEVAEFWASRDHDCQRDLGFLCSTCHQFYGECEAAALTLDLEVSRQFDTPAHRERQLAIWAERERRALVRSVAW